MANWHYSWLAALLLLALCSCPKQRQVNPAGREGGPDDALGFTTVLPASRLTDGWDPGLVREIHASPDANELLIEMAGGAIHIHRPTGEAQIIELPYALGCIDWQSGMMYSLADNAAGQLGLQVCSISEGQWSEAFDFGAGTKKEPISCSAAGNTAWFVIASSGQGSGEMVVFSMVDGSRVGCWTEPFAVVEPQACTILAQDEGCLLFADRTVYYLNNEAEMSARMHNVPALPKAIANWESFDDEVVWLYSPGRVHGEGTGREGLQSIDAQLARCSLDTGEVQSYPPGWANWQHLGVPPDAGYILLGKSELGVMQLDKHTMQSTWLLRTTEEYPVFLAAGHVWAAVPGGLEVIGISELAELSPQLMAPQTLSESQAGVIRPAVEALGWKYSSVQVSPLIEHTGRFTLFDAASPDSLQAEMDWDIDNERALRVVVARRPSPDDSSLRSLSPEGLEYVLGMRLAALGWPQAQPLGGTERSVLESVSTWQLEPDAEYAALGGEFRYWITLDGTSITLEAPEE